MSTIFNQHGQPSRGAPIRAYEGVSEYRDQSDAASLHEAIQRAAEEAARELRPPPDKETEVFEVSRIQVEVGNPNVKVYRVVLTPAGEG